jgi:hypothetical protein
MFALRYNPVYEYDTDSVSSIYTSLGAKLCSACVLCIGPFISLFR